MQLEIPRVEVLGFVRPSVACNLCRHHRGGGWNDTDQYVAICNLQKGKEVQAPKEGACELFQKGSMYTHGNRQETA